MPPSDVMTVKLPAGIDTDTFLREYWQKKPLLMRAALPPALFTLGADELAGLAAEPEVESRLISGGDDTAWQVRHGPFDETDYAALPTSHWTLLVQDVDKYVPEVAALIELFDFVPQWRIDDIMISYAVDQGGVGPHTDAYDVFLMQAAGRRRWRLSYRDYTDDDLLPGLEQRILSHFETDEDWVLEPGDILYLPPGVAHWGTADGECMTWSLGFRAPTRADLAGDWFQHLLAGADGARLRDPRHIAGDALGEIGADTRRAARTLIDALAAAGATDFDRWLGCYLTEPKPQFEIYPLDEPLSASDLVDLLDDGTGLARDPAARLAWSRNGDDAIWLFCQGEAIALPATLDALAERLCTGRRFAADECRAIMAGSAAASTLLLTLCNNGVLVADEA